MFSTMKRIALALLVAVTAQSVAYAEEVKQLNFGIISTDSTQVLRDTWTPFLEDMSKKMGVEVKPFFASDYAGIIQAMRFDKVDVAWYGNKSAIEAVDRSGGEVFAQTVDNEGNPGYWSLLLAHKDSKLNSVEDIIKYKGELTFGNGDPNSTSGFLVPSYYVFAKNDLDPKKAFKRVTNANHETNALSVANQKVDFATNNTENLRRIEEKFPEKFENIKVIWQSPLIPSDPIVWRKNLPESAKTKIYDFFMTYGKSGDKQELANLDRLQWLPFRASSDDQLLPIRQLSLFKDRLKMIKSGSQDPMALAEIDEKLAVLNRRMAALSVLASN
uniref:COG3221 ABC-type phosphate/phosphonate transport system, periplasmic component n=1 Tax=uncultured bacterium B3TF_MPn1 TaxID=1439866 RepID=W0NQA0_9BACT|nr:COG3221 ABC-type phosphate/phosphonate transport system, periplasmic component [uncultured bacterium B3TF_MPn1]